MVTNSQDDDAWVTDDKGEKEEGEIFQHTQGEREDNLMANARKITQEGRVGWRRSNAKIQERKDHSIKRDAQCSVQSRKTRQTCNQPSNCIAVLGVHERKRGREREK